MLKKLNIILASVITIVVSCIIIIPNDDIEVFSLTFFIIILLTFILSLIAVLLLIVLLFVTLSFTFRKEVYENIPTVRKKIFDLGVEFIIDIVGVKVKYSGLEKLPKDTKFLIVANHRGIFDAVLLCHTFRKEKFVAVSKPENFTLPIAGPWIKGMGHLAIDRENNRNALKTILKCIKYIEEDTYSIGICPEGTRNKGEGLLPFKSGCFKIASKAKCPLVICTITNADKVFKNFPFKKTIMEFNIVDVIEYEDLKDLSTHELALIARRKMVENLNINESLEESKQMIE
ncbi:MAG: 1-acyl-sn-glycerol-3-phosphate acyltransferase [Erysipelotrichaceae bacterium]|nr:1-acyl-sn-glycerol-3-phosphate acyltransferase [Erysipelotrichaceae bacterium]